MFKNIFNRGKVDTKINGISVIDEGHFNKIMESSFHNRVLIFKHSTRCGVSGMILNRFAKKIKDQGLDFYLVDILKNRDISNLIADKLNIRHQSPQLLYVKDGHVLSHGSHSQVLEMDF